MLRRMRAVFRLHCPMSDNCVRLAVCRECQSPVKTATNNFGAEQDVAVSAAEVDVDSYCSMVGRVPVTGLVALEETVEEAYHGVDRGLPY